MLRNCLKTYFDPVISTPGVKIDVNAVNMLKPPLLFLLQACTL